MSHLIESNPKSEPLLNIQSEIHPMSPECSPCHRDWLCQITKKLCPSRPESHSERRQTSHSDYYVHHRMVTGPLRGPLHHLHCQSQSQSRHHPKKSNPPRTVSAERTTRSLTVLNTLSLPAPSYKGLGLVSSPLLVLTPSCDSGTLEALPLSSL